MKEQTIKEKMQGYGILCNPHCLANLKICDRDFLCGSHEP